MAEGFSVVTYALCNKHAQKAISEAIEGLGDGMRFKGSVATKSDLPLIARKGDLYIVEEDKSKVVFSGGVWVEFDHELELIAGPGIEITPTLDGGVEISNTGTTFTAIVGVVNTYTDLLAYDISKLKDEDIIEVLSDINHYNTVSYYKLKPVVDSEGNINIDPFNDDPAENWQYITSQQPTYTKVEADNKFLTEAIADGKYLTDIKAGDGIDVSLDSEGIPVITNTRTNAEWGNITGNISNQTDLKNILDNKLEDSDIEAGSGISITETSEGKLEISATGQASGVISVTAGNDTITIGGTATEPTVAVTPNKFQTPLEFTGTYSSTDNKVVLEDWAESTFAPASHTHTKNQITDFPVIPTGVSTTTVNSITDVGTLPTLTFTPDATTGNLTISWSQGTLPTKGADTTVATGLTYNSQDVWDGGNY